MTEILNARPGPSGDKISLSPVKAFVGPVGVEGGLNVQDKACLKGDRLMLHYTLVFAILAIFAAFLGFGGLAVSFAEVARILFMLFLVLFIASLIMGRRV